MGVQLSSTETREYTGWFSHYKALNNNFNAWEARGFISTNELSGANVLDFGGSYGQLAIILLMHGASDVTVIDINLLIKIYRSKLKQFKKLKYLQSSIERHSKLYRISGKIKKLLKCFRELSVKPRQVPNGYDFVIAHTVTEHLEDIASSFAAVYKLLKPGGTF